MRPDPGAILERFLERPRVAELRAVLDTYGRAPGGLLANGLAFTALFASIPTALVALGVAGWLVGDAGLQAQLAESLSSLFPPLADVIDASLVALSEGAPAISIIGIVGLIWAVSQLYVAVDVAFARIFTEEPERDLVRRTLRGFLWVALIISLVIAAIVIGTLVAAADALLPGATPVGIEVIRSLRSWPVLLVAAVFAVGAIYRFVPKPGPAFRSLLAPSIVAGVAIGLLSQLFALLAPRVVGIATVVGPLATVFIALAWLSFTFQILLVGASWVRVGEERAGHRPPARPVDQA